MTRPDSGPQVAPEFSRPVALHRLNRRAPHSVDETATGPERAAVATLLGLQNLPKLRITGTLTPLDPEGWRFRGTVGATAVQSCVLTLEPVKTRVDVPVDRLYLPDADTASTRIDIDPEDEDDIEPLPDTLDLGLIAIEETALALPAYPRAAGAAEAAPPADAADEEPEARPFAALGALKSKIRDDSGKG